MTLDEFNERYWTNGMTCEYGGVRREIVTVDFAEQLIGLKSCSDSDDVDMVRCENVRQVTCPVCNEESLRHRQTRKVELVKCEDCGGVGGLWDARCLTCDGAGYLNKSANEQRC